MIDLERDFVIDNLLVRIHLIIDIIWWTGLAPWVFEFPFSGHAGRSVGGGAQLAAEGGGIAARRGFLSLFAGVRLRAPPHGFRTHQPIHQPANQPTKQPNNQITNQPTSQPANQASNKPTNQRTTQTNKQTKSPTNQTAS